MQGLGYSLDQVGAAFRSFGIDEAGLAKMESIGALKPVPPPKTDADQRPIELFEPISRAAFVRRAGCSDALVEALLERGLLRPLRPGRFDARDLWLVRMILALARDGVPVEDLGVLRELLHAARAVGPLVRRRMERHRPALRGRTLRFTDLLEPFQAAFLYFVDRALTEADPNWRQHMIDGDVQDAPTRAPPRARERRRGS